MMVILYCTVSGDETTFSRVQFPFFVTSVEATTGIKINRTVMILFQESHLRSVSRL